MTGRIEVQYLHDHRCPAYRYRDDSLTRASDPRPAPPGPCGCGHPGAIVLAAARMLATEALEATPGQPILSQKAG